MTHGEIAAEMARRFTLRPRAAWRAAWGWTLEEAAERFDALRAKNQPQVQATLTGSRLSEWENWPFSARKPSVTTLFVLAEIYQAPVLDLIDFHDRERLATADLLALDRPAQPPSAWGDDGKQASGEVSCLRPASVVAVPDSNAYAGHGSGLSCIRSEAPERPVPGMFVNADTGLRIGGISRAGVVPAVSALNDVLLGYIRADQRMGPLALAGPLLSHVPVIERLCEVAAGADRIGALAFASRFMEFCGWAHQDAGDLVAAMRWTDRGLDYALQLADPRTVSYAMMRKASITTESGLPGHGVGMSNAALSSWDALTPRLRAVILRQRALAHAMLADSVHAIADADAAIAQAAEGADQDEDDRAPYCSPTYAEMEAAAAYMRLGNPAAALPILETSRATWSDTFQVRDFALCLSRLATAYAALREPEQARKAAEEALCAAAGLRSARVTMQLTALTRMLARWERDPAMAETLHMLIAATGPA
jgi:tetratricopeptide (TPR) repeat protein